MKNNTLPNQETSLSIPWYRTRLFWGVVYVLIAIFAVTDFYLWISTTSGISSLSIWQLTTGTIFSSGGIFFVLLGGLLGKIGSWVMGALYYVIIGFCIYKTFSQKRAQVRYPIIIIVLFVLGIIIGALYTSGL